MTLKTAAQLGKNYYMHPNPDGSTVKVKLGKVGDRFATLAVGYNVKIGTGVKVLGDVIIAELSQLGDRVTLHQCHIGAKVRIGHDSQIGEDQAPITILTDGTSIGSGCNIAGLLSEGFFAGDNVYLRGEFEGFVDNGSRLIDSCWLKNAGLADSVIPLHIAAHCEVFIKRPYNEPIGLLTIGEKTKAFLGKLKGDIRIGEYCSLGNKTDYGTHHVSIDDMTIPNGADIRIGIIHKDVLIAVDGNTTLVAEKGRLELIRDGRNVRDTTTEVPLGLMTKLVQAAHGQQKRLQDAVRHAEGRYNALEGKVNSFVNAVKR